MVEQALTLFDRVIIAVGCNSEKQGLLSVESRLALLEDLYASQKRVEVCAYTGLTVDFARSRGAVAMIRGLRSTIDFEYERSLAAINSRLDINIATVVLFAPTHLADVSSNVVRELISYGHDVSDLLPDGIKIDNYINKK